MKGTLACRLVTSIGGTCTVSATASHRLHMTCSYDPIRRSSRRVSSASRASECMANTCFHDQNRVGGLRNTTSPHKHAARPQAWGAIRRCAHNRNHCVKFIPVAAAYCESYARTTSTFDGCIRTTISPENQRHDCESREHQSFEFRHSDPQNVEVLRSTSAPRFALVFAVFVDGS